MKTTGIIFFGLLALCGHLVAEDIQPEHLVVLPNFDILGAPCDSPLTLVKPSTATNAVKPYTVHLGFSGGRIAVGNAFYSIDKTSFSSVKAALSELFGRPPDHDSVKNSVSWVSTTDRGTEITVGVHYQSREITVGFGEHPVEQEKDTEHPPGA